MPTVKVKGCPAVPLVLYVCVERGREKERERERERERGMGKVVHR